MHNPQSVTGRGANAISFPTGKPATSRRRLLVIAQPGIFSDSLIAAIEHEFEWLSVECVTEMQTACLVSDSNVQLILVDHQMVESFLVYRDTLARQCPMAITAVMDGFHARVSAELMQVIESRTICGILPMDVNLDVWLSILKIMLRGGAYLPPSLLELQRHTGTQARDLAADARSSNHGNAGGGMMDELTGRELEILSKVAQGNQNKIIAADLGLSEHTVKIHMHNIIRKLGVHNRTEAAMIFHLKTNGPRTEDDGGN